MSKSIYDHPIKQIKQGLLNLIAHNFDWRAPKKKKKKKAIVTNDQTCLKNKNFQILKSKQSIWHKVH